MWLKQSADVSTACLCATTIEGPQLYDEETTNHRSPVQPVSLESPHFHTHNSNGHVLEHKVGYAVG